MAISGEINTHAEAKIVGRTLGTDPEDVERYINTMVKYYRIFSAIPKKHKNFMKKKQLGFWTK